MLVWQQTQRSKAEQQPGGRTADGSQLGYWADAVPVSAILKVGLWQVDLAVV